MLVKGVHSSNKPPHPAEHPLISHEITTCTIKKFPHISMGPAYACAQLGIGIAFKNQEAAQSALLQWLYASDSCWHALGRALHP